jgi:putative component of toxin-antitoxin plasmid stabilization module
MEVRQSPVFADRMAAHRNHRARAKSTARIDRLAISAMSRQSGKV